MIKCLTNKKSLANLEQFFYADIKGYSILMTDDEAHAIETLRYYRQVFQTTVKIVLTVKAKGELNELK